jgi:hypothetical protein
MSQKQWYVTKVRYCERVGHEIAFETEVVVPSELLPEQPPRIIAHRCSNSIECNGVDKPGCVWAATNPNYHPL